MRTVQSTNIAAIGFDANEDGELSLTGEPLGILTVQFRNGRTYRYFDVPENNYAILLEEAEVSGRSTSENGQASVGRLFTRLIRQAGFKYEEVDD
jgi:hypothetical protein